eukprot:1370546-Amphidinium_carterae.1
MNCQNTPNSCWQNQGSSNKLKARFATQVAWLFSRTLPCLRTAGMYSCGLVDSDEVEFNSWVVKVETPDGFGVC